MTPGTNSNALAASAAFSLIAERYDETFTRTTIGKAQRKVVWDALTQAFSRGDHVLELNCGTGEDAFFLARRGISLTACDASSAMVAVAERRKSLEAAAAKPRIPRSCERRTTKTARSMHLRRGLFEFLRAQLCRGYT